MPTILAVLAGAILGAVAWRVRGGWLGGAVGWGVGSARLVAWALPMGALAALVSWGSPWWLGPAVGALAFATSTLPTFGALDAGRNEGSILGDAARNLGRGLLTVAPLAALLWWCGYATWWVMLLAGAWMAPAYEIAWRWLLPADRPETAAECLFGAAFGAALVGAIALG